MARSSTDQPPRQGGGQRPPLDLVTAAALVASAAGQPAAPVSAPDLLDALRTLRWMQTELTAIEPQLISAARRGGTSWQELAAALGVGSRQAAERRYLRLRPVGGGQPAATREGRVLAERDRRAGSRAVNRWVNDNTADLRRLAGQVTALSDLHPGAAADIDRLHHALADPDATALPALLDSARAHLHAHPKLTAQIDAVTRHTDQVRHETARRRHQPDPIDG